MGVGVHLRLSGAPLRDDNSCLVLLHKLRRLHGGGDAKVVVTAQFPLQCFDKLICLPEFGLQVGQDCLVALHHHPSGVLHGRVSDPI